VNAKIPRRTFHPYRRCSSSRTWAASRHETREKEIFMAEIQTGQPAITQITVIECEPGKQDEALSVMEQRAQFMSRQPGFISISLHRSRDGRRIVNYIQWQNREQLQAAHRSPEFRKEWGHFDQVTDDIDPHLYEVAHVLEHLRNA
jgi:heme-degrading monooxygenase HmoA